MPAVADLDALTELIGLPAVMALVQAHGGLSFDVPATTRGQRYRDLVGLVGERAALALLAKFGGDAIYIAKLDAQQRAQRNAEIRAAYDAGTAVPELARRHDLTERQIYNILSRPQEDLLTLPLFC